MKFYPNAHRNRVRISHPSIREPRRGFMKAAASNFLILQLLFLGLFAFIFGALFQQGSHVHNMKVLYVDYDGGAIGASVRDAYKALQGSGFPSLIERSPTDYATPDDLESAVCKTWYWAALYTSPGASGRLEAALAGGPVATTYNRSDVLTYVWNEARYSAIVDSVIAANMQTLSSAARVVCTTSNGTGAPQTLSSTDAAAISAFENPWILTSIDIQPTTQGSRAIYNTLVIILIMIQEFFYLGTINGLYAQFKIYTRLYPHRIIIFRNLLSAAYTFIGSLCTAGAIWAFRSGWQVNSNQFALTWAALWLFAHVNFLTLDIFTIWLPAPYVPMALITWIVFNVTSILIPFALAPAFYRWTYVMPAHEVYQILVDIWSGGCNPQLHYALPILFSLEVSGLLFSGLGVYRRCHYAVVAEEAQEQAFRARLDAAMAFERQQDQEKKYAPARVLEPRSGSDSTAEGQDAEASEREREALADVIRKEDNEFQLEHSRSRRNTTFGPTFELAIGDRSNS